MYRPPDYPSSLFRSHYVESDAVYEEDDNGGTFTHSGERSSGGSYLTRSVYDNCFPSTNTIDDEIFHTLNPIQYSSSEVRNDIENEQISPIQSTNLHSSDLHHHQLLLLHDDCSSLDFPRENVFSPSNGYSDQTSDVENQRTSELEEEIVSRVPNSVFQQHSGHLSVHNLLRISSLGTGWDENEGGIEDSINGEGREDL